MNCARFCFRGRQAVVLARAGSRLRTCAPRAVALHTYRSGISHGQSMRAPQSVDRSSLFGACTVALRQFASDLPAHLVVGLPALSPTMEQGTISEWKVSTIATSVGRSRAAW